MSSPENDRVVLLESSLRMTRKQTTILIVIAAAVTIVKIYAAYFSPDTADTHGFVEYVNAIRQNGDIQIYNFRGTFNNPFNFPPSMIHFFKLLGSISDLTRLPLRFWLRMSASLSDLVTLGMVAQLLRKQKDRFQLCALLLLCPVSVFINGYEGNVDALMVTCLVLTVFLVEQHWMFPAGLALGCALSIKIAPLMLFPCFFFYLPNRKPRFQFFIGAAIVFVAFSSPYLFQNPVEIWHQVFSYGSIYGVWGISRIAVLIIGPPRFEHPPYDVVGIHLGIATFLKYLILGLLTAASLKLNSRPKKPSLMVQVGIMISSFLSLTPGFGVQYLLWLVPFVLAAGTRITLLYWFASFVCIWFALNDAPSKPATIFLFVCWASIAYCLRALLASIPPSKVEG